MESFLLSKATPSMASRSYHKEKENIVTENMSCFFGGGGALKVAITSFWGSYSEVDTIQDANVS